MADREATRPDLEPRGIRKLRVERGDQRVTFDEVADHLHDFAQRYAYAEPVVDQVAAFLARVERIPHAHLDDAATTEARAADVPRR